MEDTTENVQTVEVAPDVEDAQSDAVDTTDEVSDSPAEAQAEKEELLLGKFKSADDLAKSYKELESQFGKYNQRLNDPNFIYQMAVKHGLAEDDGTAPTRQQSPDVVGTVEAILDYREAVREMPELATDAELSAWAAALVDSGKKHTEAVKIIRSRLGQVKQSAKLEGATQAKTTISDKERASTASVTSNQSSDAAEMEDLMARSKSIDPKVQEPALLELLMRKNRQK